MKEKFYDLTNPQKSIWYTEQFFQGSCVNNLCGTVAIDQVVNFDILKKAIYKFVEDNDSFRINLFYDENGEVKQKFTDFKPFDIELIDLKNEEELIELENNMVDIPFSILNSYLHNFKMYRLPNGKGGFILTAHHLICDACTAGLVASKTINIYSSLLENEEISEPTTSYINYINSEEEYLSSNKFEKDKEYWNNVFESIPEIGIIPSIKQDDPNVCRASRKSFIFSKDQVEKLNDFCSSNKISAFNFFMAIYAIYVGKVSGFDDFVLGTPILNRSTFVEKNTPGMFISTVPFRFDMKGDISFIDFAKKISFDCLGMFRHQKYPYQNILEDIRKKNPTQPNLYDILISYQNTRTNRNTSKVPYEVRWTFNHNLADSMQIHLSDMNDDGLLNISYDYRLDKYDEDDILYLHERICFMIDEVLKDKSLLIDNIEIVTPKEKDVILNKFNDTYLKYDTTKTVVDYFEEQVKKTPDNVALVCENKTLTYKELNEKANSLAHYLRENNVNVGDIVGIMVHRSTEMIVGLLAILKVGACYLPIDPEYPTDRINYILNDSESKTLLVHTSTLNTLSDSKYKKINIDLNSDIYATHKVCNLNTIIKPNNLIYMIYTSGSTGNPKGVMITHRNINNFIISEKNVIDFTPEKVMVSVTTICFDIFALEIWCSLTSGMKVILASDLEQLSPNLLRDLCIKNKVSMIQTTPSRFSALLADVDKLDFLNTFTDIMVGGEPFPKLLLDKLQKYSNANIYNMYGPTETTVWSTIKDLSNTSNITIGKPIGNTTCYILDKNKNLLPIGVPGELYIGGDGVTKGYWKRNTLTSEKFIVSPFSKDNVIYNTNDLAYFNKEGEIIHLGRTDFQVKIRGYRIELEEIQNKLLSFEGISDCVVISKDNKFLVCYYVADKKYPSSSLSSFLLESLPNYMIPAYFVKLDTIPLTPNGKLNRHLLPDVVEEEKEIAQASTDTEIKISQVISNILDINNLDINTPFLNLGLDSLGIIKAQTMLLKYNFILTTQDFYKYSTIKKLADRIDSNIYNYQEQDIEIPDEFKHKSDEILSKISSINKNEDCLNNVFLTGANGFVGIHVLYELLNTTNNAIYCLVRGKSIEHSLERLKKAYMFYFNTDISKYVNNRIYIVSGDIDAPNFGIDISLFNNYLNNFSTVIHTAAIVKHYGSFEDFRKINIDGTKNVVEFAYAYKKRLIHISSISVSGNYLVKQNNKDIDFSENSLYIGQHYSENVYVNSKLEAERIVLSYMQKGLTAQIHRIGILSGRYSDGVFQEKISENAFYNRIKSMVSLGSISEDMLDQSIEFTPVDSCSKAIVSLAKNSICNNKVFHLYDHNLMKVRNLVDLFKNVDININILSKKDFNDFIYNVSLDANNTNLNSIINDISYDSNHLLSLNYDFTVNIISDTTQKYLHLLNFDWPNIDDTYVLKILTYMKKVNFI